MRMRIVLVTENVAWRWIRSVHNAASRTLAPSTESMAALTAHGVQRGLATGRPATSMTGGAGSESWVSAGRQGVDEALQLVHLSQGWAVVEEHHGRM